jgi:serine/threonine-protein kinase
MTAVDPTLITAACAALGVHDVGAIGAPAGQKAVRHVKRGADDLILKVIALRSSSPTTLTRAEREVALLKSLTNPHVVRVESDLVRLGNPTNGAAWLEEFLDGDDLSAHLGRRWQWPDVVDMGHQIADGLAAGHAKGVIHRDLSPNNVRCLSDGTYRVMDFGFARFTLQTGVTVGGQPGTYGYHSPEHLNGHSGAPIPSSDVFGVGVLMFQALTGQVPIAYTGDDADYARRLSTAEIPDLATLRPDLHPDALAIMRRILHPQPARRFRNGRALADALAAI